MNGDCNAGTCSHGNDGCGSVRAYRREADRLSELLLAAARGTLGGPDKAELIERITFPGLDCSCDPARMIEPEILFRAVRDAFGPVLALLKALEWTATGDAEEGGYVPCCPSCGVEQRDGEHLSGCDLADAIEGL